MSNSIGVFARVRPGPSSASDISVVKDESSEHHQKAILVRNLEFSLDFVFDSDASQEEIYDIVGRPRVSKVADGFNVCIIAYGQTGSGKTHTMFGPDEVLSDWKRAPPEKQGLALRAINDLFVAADASESSHVACSYIEVYNDQCNDLLGQQRGLVLREGRDGIITEGLQLEAVASLSDAMASLTKGNAGRTTAQMSMNLRSSRSHAVFSLSLRLGSHSEGGEVSTGKLVLVDLAGMESSKKSFAVEGASASSIRREEAKHINVSLYALGTVIEKLSGVCSPNPAAHDMSPSLAPLLVRTSYLRALRSVDRAGVGTYRFGIAS